jgi:hypothetical protein
MATTWNTLTRRSRTAPRGGPPSALSLLVPGERRCWSWSPSIAIDARASIGEQRLANHDGIIDGGAASDYRARHPGPRPSATALPSDRSETRHARRAAIDSQPSLSRLVRPWSTETPLERPRCRSAKTTPWSGSRRWCRRHRRRSTAGTLTEGGDRAIPVLGRVHRWDPPTLFTPGGGGGQRAHHHTEVVPHRRPAGTGRCAKWI